MVERKAVPRQPHFRLPHTDPAALILLVPGMRAVLVAGLPQRGEYTRQEHRADQPGNNEDDDKWCRDHCGLVPPECPALFCKCDPPTYDLPPNMQDTQGEGAHVKGGMIPS